MKDVNVSSEEIAAAFKGPAFAVNKTVVTFSPILVRLAFLELAPTGAAEFRAAVQMSTPDLVALKTLIDHVLTSAET